MALTRRTCGKIQTRRIKNGESHNLLLVHNYRSFMTGKAVADVVFNFGTIRSYNIPKQAASMWLRINVALNRLVADGHIDAGDAARAKRKFAKLLGTPPAPTAPVAKPKRALTAEERLRERFPNLF